jgi:hypothetical protein
MWQNMRACQIITNIKVESNNSVGQENILSVMNHKLNVPRHTLMWTLFVVFVCGTRVQILSATFSYALNNTATEIVV